MESSSKIGAFILTAIVAAAVGGGGVYYYFQNRQQSAPVTAETPTPAKNNEQSASMAVQPPAPSQESRATSEVESLPENDQIPTAVSIFSVNGPDRYELATYDYSRQILFKQEKQDVKKVVVNDFSKEYPELGGRGVSFSGAFDHTLVLATYLPDSDSGYLDYYAFDLSALTLKKMKINEIYKGSYEPEKDYEEGRYLAYAPTTASGPEKLYVIDFTTDSYKTVTTLKPGESLSAGSGGLSNYSSIEWMSENKIRFAVFNKSKQDTFDYENPYKNLIEYREVTF